MASIVEAGAAMSQVVTDAIRADNAALETALAMAWTCLGDGWADMVTLERHTTGCGLPEARLVLEGRVIHRQWWARTGDYTWTLRQEWCP